MPFTWTMLLAEIILRRFDDFYGFLIFAAMIADVGFLSAIYKAVVK